MKQKIMNYKKPLMIKNKKKKRKSKNLRKTKKRKCQLKKSKQELQKTMKKNKKNYRGFNKDFQINKILIINKPQQLIIYCLNKN